MLDLLYIHWDASPEIFRLGPVALRWYGLLFALGFLLGLYMVRRMFLEEGAPEEWLDKCFMYMILGAILGARLGHVFFYDWDYYSHHLSEIPMVWKGGLASHGGAIGILISMWLFSRSVSKKPVLWILDKVAVPTALAGFFIRMGNLMNSEILGKAAPDLSWAFVFERVDDIPRHPVQLYEALAYLLIFVFMYFVYWRTAARHTLGRMFGWFMVLVFGARFLLEPFKAKLGGLEDSLSVGLSTGQLLSIPLVLVGLYFLLRPAAKKA